MRPSALASLLAPALCGLAGCASEPLPEPRPSKTEVQVSGAGDLLQGEAAPETRELLEGVRSRLSSEGRLAAGAWAARWPAEALRALRTAPPAAAQDPAYAALAWVRDALCPTRPPEQGWRALLARGEPAELARARRELYAALGSGDGLRARELAEDLELDGYLEPTLATLALRELVARTALLAAEDEDEEERAERLTRADARWSEAGALARRLGCLDRAAEAELARAAIARRQADLSAARARWLDAATLAARALAQRSPLLEPGLWERLIETRPAEQAWPLDARAPLVAAAALGVRSSLEPPLPEGLAWACVARWRRARGEEQAALRAFLHAEEDLSEPWAGHARLAQARLLLDMNQTGAAAGVLAGLTSHPQPDVAEPALALLGTIYLRQRRVRQALGLLKQAAEGEAREWEGKAEALADLGLTYLALGDEPQGLRWLRAAQERFRARGDQELLRRSLTNELRYHRHVDNDEEVARLQAELARL